MSKIKPNIVRGGRAIDLGNNLFYMSGKKHSQGGIDIGQNAKTGLEVEGGEVVQITPQSLKVFSAQPILNGISPAQYILGGANPNQVFNAQEYWKQVNRVNDDGTKAIFGVRRNKNGYTTKLNKKQEVQFRNWYKNVSSQLKLNENPDTYLNDYDYRGYWLENKDNNIDFSIPDFHFPDKYKTPFHETFSNESVYASKKYGVNPKDVGHWEGDTFVPGVFNNIMKEEVARDKEHARQARQNIGQYFYNLEPYAPSQEIIDYIKDVEKFSPTWYKDGKGIDTIGYGFTGSDIKKQFPNGITKEEADRVFADSLAVRAKILERDTPNWSELNQNQRDALLSYHYNIGEGAYRDKNPNLMKALEKGDWETATQNIDFGYNDKKNSGLRIRRDYERNLFNTPVEYKYGGRVKKQIGGETDRKVIGYGTPLESRLRYLNLDKKLVAYINKLSKDYDISPALLTERLFHEGVIDKNIKEYDKSVNDNVLNKSLLDKNYGESAAFNIFGLDDSYSLITQGKLNLRRKIPVTSNWETNEKGRDVNYAGTKDAYDAIEIMAANIEYYKNLMKSKFPNLKDRDLDTATNKAYNMGPNAAYKDILTNGIGNNYKISDSLYNYNYNNDFYLKNKDNSDIINIFPIEQQKEYFDSAKDIYKTRFKEIYGKEFDNPIKLKLNTVVPKGNFADEYGNHMANRIYNAVHLHPFGTDYSYNNPFYNISTEFKYGGIHIKPSKRGTFTAEAKRRGLSVQELAARILANKHRYSSAMIKKAVFARNARKWKHKEFGGEMTNNYYITPNNIYKLGGRKKVVDGTQIMIPYGTERIPIDSTYSYLRNIYTLPLVTGQLDTTYVTGNKKVLPNIRGNVINNSRLNYVPNQSNPNFIGPVLKPNFDYSELNSGLDTAYVYANRKNLPSIIGKVISKDNLEYTPNQNNPNFIGPVYKPNFDDNAEERISLQLPTKSSSPSSILDSPLMNRSLLMSLARLRNGNGQPAASSAPQTNSGITITEHPATPVSSSTNGNIAADAVVLQDNAKPVSSNPINRERETYNLSVSNPLALPPSTLPVSGLNINRTNPGLTNLQRIGLKLSNGLRTGLNAVGNFIRENPLDVAETAINLGGNLAASLINRRAIKDLQSPSTPLPLRANKLKTRVNINPQLDEIRETVSSYEDDVTRNTASSKTALANRQNIRARGMQYANQLYGQKENVETSLINEDRMNQQNVGNQNVQLVNNWLRDITEFNNNKRLMQAENSVAGINNATEALSGFIGAARTNRQIEMQRDRDILSAAIMAVANPNAQKVLGDASIINSIMDNIRKQFYTKK